MPKVVIAIPAYNEEAIIESTVSTIHTYAQEHLSDEVLIVISNNASVDRTAEIGNSLKNKYKGVDIIHNNFRSMSKGILRVWRDYEADYYLHIDADLSADPSYIKTLITGAHDGADIMIGSRRLKQAKENRSPLRRYLSHMLTLFNKTLFKSSISDYQCGFKAISKKVRDHIAPQLVCLEHGFFSTELIVVASSMGYDVREFPMIWEDTRETKTQLFASAVDALSNLIRIKYRLMTKRYAVL